MRLRVFLASLAVATGLVALAAGPGLAQTTDSGDRVVQCERAEKRLDRIANRIAKLERRIADGAVKNEARANERLDRLERRAKRIADRIAEHCTA